MTFQQALETARTLHAEYTKVSLAKWFAGQVSDADYDATDAQFSRRHGWYLIDGHSISEEQVTGQAYDSQQGGWAWV